MSCSLGPNDLCRNPGLIAGIAVLSILSIIALGFIAVLFVLYKKGRFNFAPSSSSKSEEGGVDWSESAYPTYLPTEHGVGFGQGAVNGGPENYDLNSTTSPTSGRAMSSSGHGPVSPAQGTAYTSSSSRVLSPQDDYSIQAAPSTSRSTNVSPHVGLPTTKWKGLLIIFLLHAFLAISTTCLPFEQTGVARNQPRFKSGGSCRLTSTAGVHVLMIFQNPGCVWLCIHLIFTSI